MSRVSPSRPIPPSKGRAHRPIDALSLRGRFFRSANIERDFNDASALDDLIITPVVSESIIKVASGLSKDSTRRSWRITGDYGAGKSTCGLVMAHAFSPDFQNRALARARQSLRDTLGLDANPALWPILILGQRASLSRAILNGCNKSLSSVRLNDLVPGRRRALRSLLSKTNTALEDGVTDPERVVDIISDVNAGVIESGLANGLFFLLDELGKFLEYAAAHASQSDIYLLQLLAEFAARSKTAPIALVGLLHQGVETYAEGLPKAAQREWAKVAGRFDEIVFANGVPAVAELVAGSLMVDRRLVPRAATKILQDGMKAAISIGWYGPDAQVNRLSALAARIYPVHPAVIPVMTALGRRFGQNERTVLSAILSGDAYSVVSWAQVERAADDLYTIADLFDYLRSVGGVRVDDYSRRAYWPRLVAAVDAVDKTDRAAVAIMKSVAVLNLVETDGFIATEESIAVAVESPKGLKRILARLKGRGLLHDRGGSAGFAAWPHSSVDLGRAVRLADEAVGTVDVVPSVAFALASRAIVAKRHYVERGTLRHFRMRYLRVADLPNSLRASPETWEADGEVWVVLAADDSERAQARNLATDAAAARRPDVIIGVSEALEGLSDVVHAATRWRYLVANTPELGFDSFAADEARRSLHATEQALVQRARIASGLVAGGGVEWYRGAQPVGSGVERLSLIASTACDELYPDSPRVANELVNRRALSSAAASARMRLIERVLESASSPLLGLPEGGMPPEKSMYLSLFKAGGLHKRLVLEGDSEGSANWCVRLPSADYDPLRFGPVFEFIASALRDAPSGRAQISEIFTHLQRPPYGVREGLLPLLLATFVAANDGEVAFYERGTFTRAITGAVFMRLMKDPTQFEAQWHPGDALHATLYRQISTALREVVRRSEGAPAEAVVEVVRELCEFAVSLPDYTRRTALIPTSASRVRSALFSARDPVHLLFTELPACVGIEPLILEEFSPGSVQIFVSHLAEALASLRDAYPRLLARVKSGIGESFGLSDPEDLRARLCARAEHAAEWITEIRLRGFCLRLSDSKLNEPEWLESICNFVIEKPPRYWSQQDELAFALELDLLAKRLERVELARAVHSESPHEQTFRLICTRPDGEEIALIARVSPQELAKVTALTSRLMSALGSVDNIALAAIGKVLTTQVVQNDLTARCASASDLFPRVSPTVELSYDSPRLSDSRSK